MWSSTMIVSLIITITEETIFLRIKALSGLFNKVPLVAGIMVGMQ